MRGRGFMAMRDGSISHLYLFCATNKKPHLNCENFGFSLVMRSLL